MKSMIQPLYVYVRPYVTSKSVMQYSRVHRFGCPLRVNVV
jgi:hypothetical protein